ncbi:CDP-alcohol phosphatidyltransferase [Burkholderiales bacterium 8X]|nr:CDP-alcohol phosphatidyltransferase [Burkholderiales bacterium 8X]
MPFSGSIASNPLRAFAPEQLARLRIEAIAAFVALLAIKLCVGVWLAASSDFGAAFVLRALLVFGCGFGLMLRALPAHAPRMHFGDANRVTLARLMLIALLAAAFGEPVAATGIWPWIAVGVATAAALLDAVDGPLARRSGLSSDFGARFDMECDAFLVLVLSLLVLWFDKAGSWIVAAGLLRYAFVAAAWALPWLAGELPPSLRRKSICVLQITCLIVCLGPIVDVDTSRFIAAASLLALVASFAIDIAWLFRRHRSSNKETP